MHPFRIICFAIAILCLPLHTGCSLLSKQPAANGASPVSFGDRATASAKYVAGKSKDATVTTLKYVGVGAIKLTAFVFTSVLKNLGDDDDDRKPGFDPDPLWRAGYGFNNPNAERRRQGLPPVNFDGSVDD